MAKYFQALKAGQMISSKPPVMDYRESFSSANVWKVERDVYNELVELIKKFDLQLSLDLLTAGNGSCCMIAILQGLQREEVSRHMSKEVIKKAKDYDTNWLRNAVSDFVLASPQKVKHLKENYEIYQASIGSQVVWEELWSNSPRGMRNPNLWGNNYFLGAAALFLQINIKILDTQMQRTANTQTMFNTFYGNQEPAAPPLFLGLRNGCHFQALIPVGTNYGVESEAQPNGIIDIDDANQSEPKKRILTEEKKGESPVPKKRVLTESEEAKIERKKEEAKLRQQRSRAKSSEEKKSAVREKNRVASKVYMQKKREGSTQEEKEAEKEASKIRMRDKREGFTQEEKDAENKAARIRMSTPTAKESSRIRKKEQRDNFTEEEREAYLESHRIAMSKHREKLTDDQKDSIRRSDRLRKRFEREERAMEDTENILTEENREALRLSERIRKVKERAALTEERRDEIREEDRCRKTTPEAREANRLRMQGLRNDDEAAEKEREANRLRMRRLREALEEDEEALERHREANRRASAAYLRQQNSKVATKDGLRSEEVLSGTLPVPPLEETQDSIGKMNVKCSKCGASKFKNESKGFCCNDGKVLPDPFPKPPPKLFALWTGQGVQANILKEFAREINNAVCLSSLQVNRRHFSGFTPSVIFQGRMSHRIGPLVAEEGETPKFAQLYTLDPQLESTERFNNMRIPESTPRHKKTHLKSVLEVVQEVIHEVNPFVKDFKQIAELSEEDIGEGKIVISAKEKPADEHPRRYNAPGSLHEVSILTNEQPHDLVLHKRGGGLQTVSDLNPVGMPLHFVLLFVYGTHGWDPTEKHSTGLRRISTREFFCSHLQLRDNPNKNYIHLAGRLFQEWICMSYVTVEDQRLNYIDKNQKELRADSYKSVKEATDERLREAARADGLYTDDHSRPAIGRKILPSSVTGTPRFFNKKFQDGMAICREYSKPDLFITMTCNSGWDEIVDELLPQQKAQDRPDIVARVFKLKKEQMKKDIIKGSLFGKIAAHLNTNEWQKRGLPHDHGLYILAAEDRNMSSEFVDSIVSAELPPDPNEASNDVEKEQRERMQEIVTKCMIHGPCGNEKPSAPCMENGKCSKGFPKPFQKDTIVDTENSYATYRRRSPADGGRTIQINGRTVDNSWVVPYNPYLSLRYKAHINVEFCSSPKAVKYLCKYTHKGNDRAMVSTHVEGEPRNEIAEYQDLRSVSSGEAAWHLFGFPICDRYPGVMALRVHLEEQQQVVFDEDTEMEALENQRDTELTAFFQYNEKVLSEGDKRAEDLPKYVDMPKSHVYDKKNKVWKVRKSGVVIGRVHSINPIAGEVYFLRILLHHNHCRGKRSFEELFQIPGKRCETYKDVCFELGLLSDDNEWKRILEEAAATKMCPEIRELFVILLLFCMPAEPLTLFTDNWVHWYDDIQHKAQRGRGITLNEGQLKTMVLLDLEDRLGSYGKSLGDFELPIPTEEEMNQVRAIIHDEPAVIREELDYVFEDLERVRDERVPTFTEEQREVYETILNAVRNEESIQVFIDARGGCGKTYLINALLAAVRTLEPGGCIALAMATTGIAANLLDLGRTFHSRMKAPLNAAEDSCLAISAQSSLAKLIRRAKLLLIDEGTMLDKFLLEAMDRTLRDLMKKSDKPFGGKIIIIAGDFRQCLPVVKFATRPGIVKHCINQSSLWSHFKILKLTTNMRVNASGDGMLEEFDKWTLKIGNGEIESATLPSNMIATKISPNTIDDPQSEVKAMEEFCNKIFPNIETNISDRKWLEGRTILAATNEEVDMINEHIIKKLPGNAEVFASADELEHSEDLLRFNVEYLNTLTPNGFPTHNLILKAGQPLMLLRNLNARQGLCNGTRLIYERALDNKLLICKVAGTERTVFIPRIILIPKSGEYPFGWQRRQFPVRACFSVSVNKSQGQTLKYVGVWGRSPLFTHGQLYVAVSRVGSPDNIKFAVKEDSDGNPKAVENIVFREVLLPN